jgi:hypothetical protein
MLGSVVFRRWPDGGQAGRQARSELGSGRSQAVSRIAAGVRWRDPEAEARARADLAAAKARQNRRQARALLEEADALEADEVAS